MKDSVRVCIALALTLCLVAGGVVIGARRGWTSQQADVNALRDGTGGLTEILAYQAADASNLLVVARRHMNAKDPLLVAMEGARDTLASATASVTAKQAAGGELLHLAASLSEALHATPSFNESTRDQNYLVSLLRDLHMLAASVSITEYNKAADAYNTDMANSFSGRVAMTAGISPIPLYAPTNP